MPKWFGSDWSRAELTKRVGDVAQVAGISRLAYTEGPERGVEVLRFRTGSGLDFDLLPGRGLDLGQASYNGRPLAWASPVGVVHAAHYEPEGLGWLRGFGGGLLVTCGLTNAGAPGEDPGATGPGGAPTEVPGNVRLGLHGRASYTQARAVAADCAWEGDDYLLYAQGRVREAIVFGEHVELLRRVQAKAGKSKINIVDEVTNHGHQRVPHMLLYHCNLGWPLLSEHSRLVVSGGEPEPRDEAAEAGIGEWNIGGAPEADYPEQVFYHTTIPDERGSCQAALYNDQMGLGLGLRWRAAELDQFAQWKVLARGTYVCGLEPANCRVGGRAEEREAGRLKYLEPGQTVQYVLSLEVLDGPAAMAAFEQECAR